MGLVHRSTELRQSTPGEILSQGERTQVRADQTTNPVFRVSAASWCDALPHPGLLPKEKEKRARRLGNVPHRDWLNGQPSRSPQAVSFLVHGTFATYAIASSRFHHQGRSRGRVGNSLPLPDQTASHHTCPPESRMRLGYQAITERRSFHTQLLLRTDTLCNASYPKRGASTDYRDRVRATDHKLLWLRSSPVF